MTDSNYNPMGGTPLFDQIAVTLGTVLAKSQEFSDAGVPCRTVTVIVTDGADEHSRTHRKAAALAPLVRDLLKTEMHIIAFMGIDDGSTDFRAIARELGIPDEWILTPKNTPSEIRKAFALVSQSAVRASLAAGAAGFSKVAGGGFGTP
jgi:activator of 2-hydroxyglutaryl-CoA dehydratase